MVDYTDLEARSFERYNRTVWYAADQKSGGRSPDGGDPEDDIRLSRVQVSRRVSQKPRRMPRAHQHWPYGPNSKNAQVHLLAAVVDCVYANGTGPLSLFLAELYGEDLNQTEGTARQWLDSYPFLASLFDAGGLLAIYRYAGLTNKEVPVFELHALGFTFTEIARSTRQQRGNAYNCLERAKAKMQRLALEFPIQELAG